MLSPGSSTDALAPYDPESYWNNKARDFPENPLAAVCTGDSIRDACIDRVQHDMIRRSLRWVRRHYGRREARAFDFGCGSGRWYPLLTRGGWEYHGADISAEMLSLATRHHPGGSYVKLASDSIPYPSAHFDLVLSVAVLHHNPYPRQEALMAELSRIVKPGGYVLSFEGIAYGAARTTGPFFYRTPQDWRHRWHAVNLKIAQQCAVRYALLERLWHALWLRAQRQRIGHHSTTLMHRALLQLDRLVDPYLTSRTPGRHHDRYLLVLRKD